MDFPRWAPPSLILFYEDHQDCDYVAKDHLKVLHEMLNNPDMGVFWKQFSRRFPGREYDLFYVVVGALDVPTQTISERMQDARDLCECFEALERKLSLILPGARAKDGRPLLEHLEWVRKFRIETDEESLYYLSNLPERKTKHVKLKAVVSAVDDVFDRKIGYEMLAKLGTVVTGEVADKTTIRDILVPIRKRRDPDLHNPLIRDAIRRRHEQCE